jgi:hypothetical protein
MDVKDIWFEDEPSSTRTDGGGGWEGSLVKAAKTSRPAEIIL